MALLILGGMATLAWLMTRWFTGASQMPVLVWVGGLLLGVGLPLVGWGIAGHAFQDIARPLADLMDAADAVAVGKLHVHVAEESPGDFGRLAQTFNRMTRELERAEDLRPPCSFRASIPPALMPSGRCYYYTRVVCAQRATTSIL